MAKKKSQNGSEQCKKDQSIGQTSDRVGKNLGKSEEHNT